jgi:hypothetical protein
MKIEITFGEKRQKTFDEIYDQYLACWHRQQNRKARLATIKRTFLLSGAAFFLLGLAAAMSDSQLALNILTVPAIISVCGFFGGFIVWFFVFLASQWAGGKIEAYEQWIERFKAQRDATAENACHQK